MLSVYTPIIGFFVWTRVGLPTAPLLTFNSKQLMKRLLRFLRRLNTTLFSVVFVFKIKHFGNSHFSFTIKDAYDQDVAYTNGSVETFLTRFIKLNFEIGSAQQMYITLMGSSTNRHQGYSFVAKYNSRTNYHKDSNYLYTCYLNGTNYRVSLCHSFVKFHFRFVKPMYIHFNILVDEKSF